MLTHSLKAPGFSRWTYQMRNWFQTLLSRIQLVPLQPGHDKDIWWERNYAISDGVVGRAVQQLESS
jgi:hypothetical protein